MHIRAFCKVLIQTILQDTSLCHGKIYQYCCFINFLIYSRLAFVMGALRTKFLIVDRSCPIYHQLLLDSAEAYRYYK